MFSEKPPRSLPISDNQASSSSPVVTAEGQREREGIYVQMLSSSLTARLFSFLSKLGELVLMDGQRELAVGLQMRKWGREKCSRVQILKNEVQFHVWLERDMGR